MAANAKGRAAPWIKHLLSEDFAAGCKKDRFCVTCTTTFCDHCCTGHHRGQGHEVIIGAATSSSEGGQPCAVPGRSGDRDSFCLDCTAGFSTALCTHHSGHKTVRIMICKGCHCICCTGSEPWFPWFYGIQMYDDEQGHKLVLLLPRCGGANSHFVHPLLVDDSSGSRSRKP